jgi:hypothetical protein
MHAQGISWARIGEQVGHDDITTTSTSRVYTHVVADEREIDEAGIGKADDGFNRLYVQRSHPAGKPHRTSRSAA